MPYSNDPYDQYMSSQNQGTPTINGYGIPSGPTESEPSGISWQSAIDSIGAGIGGAIPVLAGNIGASAGTPGSSNQNYFPPPPPSKAPLIIGAVVLVLVVVLGYFLLKK